jgi:hypothetical protein
MASTGGYCPCSGFLNCPHASATAALDQLLHNYHFLEKTHSRLSLSTPFKKSASSQLVKVKVKVKVKVILQPTVSRPVHFGVGHPSGTCDQFFPLLSLIIFLDSCGFVDVGAPFLTRSRVCTIQFLPVIANAAFLRSYNNLIIYHYGPHRKHHS